MNLNIPVPLYDQKAPWGSWSTRSTIKSDMDLIKSKYSDILKSVSILTNVSEQLLISTIKIESEGKSDAMSTFNGTGGKIAHAYGLMQVTLDTANDIVKMEKRRGALTDAEYKALGNRLTGFTESDLFSPATNLLIGAIYLGMLIDEETVPVIGMEKSETGGRSSLKSERRVRMDRVVLRYNGYYTKMPAKFSSYQTVWDNSIVSMRPYLLKVLGVDGTLDILLS